MYEALDIRRSCRLPGALATLFGACLLLVPVHLEGQNLRGSPASLDRQNAQARAHNFSYIQTPSQVREFVDSEFLVRVQSNSDFDLHLVSYPYARPAVKVFIERFAAQYRSACGEKLVVTSLTRPVSEQPANASSRSVHPTGMAVDLRRSGSARCRNWLESTLLSLQSENVLEVIYERSPPHYHLALYPDPYMNYLANRGVPNSMGAVATRSEPEPSAPAQTTGPAGGVYRVARGENLTSIAARFGVTLTALRAENGLRSDKILVGQQLRIPNSGPGALQAVAAVATPVPANSVQASLPPANRTAQSHTIARGENLTTIAQRFGVSLAALRAENGISGDKILVGQRLRIPGTGSSNARAATGSVQASLPPAERQAQTHTIARGESLWEIARSYGVSEAAIRAANGISGSRILVGQKLQIPVDGESAAVLRYTVKNGDSLWVIASRLGTTVDEIRASNGMDTTRIYAGQVLTVPLTR